MAKKKKGMQCVHCRRELQESTYSADHVPPKGLFKGLNAGDLVKVPACTACNAGRSDNDEDFRDMVAMRKGIGDRPEAAGLVDAMRRALANPNKEARRDAILRGISTSEKWHHGVFLGWTTTYEADFRRMNQVVERTIAGLYWHHFNACVPEGFRVVAVAVEQLDGYNLTTLSGMRGLIETSSQSGPHRIGGGAFEYSFGAADGDARTTAWNLRFWGEWYFLGATVPEEGVAATPPLPPLV